MEDAEMEDVQEKRRRESQKSVYLPAKGLQNGEDLECDFSAYVMYHHASTVAPCLSFDIVKDDLGDNRSEFPLALYIVCGTQSGRSHVNSVIAMRMSNLHPVKQKSKKDSDSDNGEDSDSDSDDESDDYDDIEEEEAKKPLLNAALIPHQGCVNRIRVNMVDRHPLAASWSELGKIHIWDMTKPLQATADIPSLQQFQKISDAIKPAFTFTGHLVEGYAVDWSPVMQGYLATGDCNKNIHVWKPAEGCSWIVDQRPYAGHTASVEDIQWSPNEANVLASCSVDHSIRIWDIRVSPSKACMIKTENAHSNDVNVISWNRHEPLLLSGGDDGVLKVWDLRQIKTGEPVAIFKHHTAPITSVEWHPTDSSTFAASGADDQITIWDLAVEKDAHDEAECSDLENLPPQLLFVHQGQKEVKELHWHHQIPGVIISTAADGFNVFKTISI